MEEVEAMEEQWQSGVVVDGGVWVVVGLGLEKVEDVDSMGRRRQSGVVVDGGVWVGVGLGWV
ncbi:hypothetical protein Acr_25g0005530 [Actinidia rufa]|uniref:Uncharacterized protein n=1 Tax=Actinidia rufa TaxID=165716 RepID=A0A7J0H035_9ERIC|nr:hypothetical protein Acr_25g0005530 [Actinidia rufa]